MEGGHDVLSLNYHTEDHATIREFNFTTKCGQLLYFGLKFPPEKKNSN